MKAVEGTGTGGGRRGSHHVLAENTDRYGVSDGCGILKNERIARVVCLLRVKMYNYRRGPLVKCRSSSICLASQAKKRVLDLQNKVHVI